MSALRSASVRYPPKYEVLEEAFVDKRVNSKTGRVGKHFLCKKCKGVFPTKEVQVDHIYPVIDPEKGFQTWDSVVERMFCDKSDFQVMCKPCHKEKTDNERQLRKMNNDKKE